MEKRIQYSWIFSILMLLIACQESEGENIVDGYTEINLTFPDFDPRNHKGFLDIKIENGISPIQEQLKISDSGKAAYSFINKRDRELIIDYENRKTSLIVSPDDLIDAEILISELGDWSKELKSSNISSGTYQETNNLILHSTKWLDSLIASAPNGMGDNGRSEELDLKEERLAYMEEQLQTFDNYIKENHIKDEAFISWGKAEIRYATGSYLAMYPFYGKYNAEMVETDKYFDFIETFETNTKDELIYFSYLDYLEKRTLVYLIVSNISDKYANEREKLEKDSISRFRIPYNMLKDLPDNKDKEYLMANAYKLSPNVPKTYYDSLNLFVSPVLKDQLQSEKSSETATIVSLLREYDIEENEKEELIELYNALKGKAAYHDFWFATCKPCVMEMPHYNELMSLTNEEEVVFIFYGVHMDNEEWQKGLDKFDLGGIHYLLSKNQLAFFEKYFGVQGFPHHHLVKPDGSIDDKIPFQTFPSNFDAILGRINGSKNTQP